MSINDLNDKQKEAAITNDQNVLVSAGAGSGKTKTLTEKVIKIISDKNIDITQLLVLTFTNNAAHEMKTRIIDAFAKDPNLAQYSDQIRSAHIQTFDSFAQDIVSMYATELGLSSTFTVIDEVIFSAKKKELLDKILLRYYSNPDKKQIILKTLKKYNLNDDSFTSQVILDLYSKLDNLIPSKREEKIQFFKNGAFTKEHFDSLFKKIIENYKQQTIKLIYDAYFEFKYSDIIDTPSIANSLTRDEFATWNWESLNFSKDGLATYAQGYYEVIKFILKEKNNDEFVRLINLFKKSLEDMNEGFSKPKKRKEEMDQYRAVEIFKKIIGLSNSLLSPFTGTKSSDQEYANYLSTQEDVCLIIDIVNELRDELKAYKVQANCFTFNDIAQYSLELLTNPKYEKCANEIKNRYKYIMVDEYQDTNDLQEAVINQLTSLKEDGSKSLLFCVGDAKQSIYGFRNSNVEIFKDRERLYNDDESKGKVIYMNTNYRSLEVLIDDINCIFEEYMTKRHGGISYYNPSKSNPDQLKTGVEYDQLPEVDHNESETQDSPDKDGLKPFYGLNMLCPEASLAGKRNADDSKEWEMNAIINHIKTNVNNPNFLVYDRDGRKFRLAKYSDFAIICTTKSGYNDYKEAFIKAGIPLNNVQSTSLNEIDCVLVIQSLINWINLEINKDTIHNYNSLKQVAFASVARSYVCEYSDDYIYSVFKDNEIDNDPLSIKVNEFIKNNRDKSFIDIFKALINEFDIVSKLPLIGNVDDNVNKIESLFKIIDAQAAAGEGLENFVELIKNIDKYELDFETKSEMKIDDAVSMMSIHASKGLEYKIVYLPYSYNHLMKGSNFNRPPYTYNEDIGICLYNYEWDMTTAIDHNTKTIPSIAANLESKQDVDEHVRLFYVALTRAENSVYIVGQQRLEDQKEKDNETIYGMLDYLPHYVSLNHSLPYDKIPNKRIYIRYLNAIELIMKLRLSKANDNSLTNRLYDGIWYKYIHGGVARFINNCIEDVCKQLLKYYLKLQISRTGEYRVFGWYVCKQYVNSKDELIQLLKNDELTQKGKYIWTTYTYDVGPRGKLEAKKNINVLTCDNIDEQFKKFNDEFIKPLYESWSDDDERSVNLPDDWKDLLKGFIRVFEGHGIDLTEIKYLFKNGYKDGQIVSAPNMLYDPKTPILDHIEVNDQEITSDVIYKQSASIRDVDLVPQELLDRGTYMHKLMQLVDLDPKSNTFKDTSFIKNDNDRRLINNVLSQPFWDILKDADLIHKEAGYFDPLMNSNVFIDLLVKNKDQYYIIDYKLSKIDLNKYEHQIKSYERNVSTLFNTNNKNIHLVFIGLNSGEINLDGKKAN